MDLLPSVNKAYFMILHVQKQQVHISVGDASNSCAMFVRSENFKRDGTGRGNLEETYHGYNVDRHCDHCNVDGYTQDTCFKLHGYPDWNK